VLFAETGEIALVADESALGHVISQGLRGKSHSGSSLLGAAQGTVVDAIVREAAFVAHYYTDDGIEINVDDLIWSNKKVRPTNEKLELSDVNVLQKGDFSRIAEDGKRYLICVDGTEASRKSFDATMEKVRPGSDFVFLLAVRERQMPDHIAMHAKDNPGRVEWEYNLWLCVRHMMAPLREELMDRQVDFMILGPRGADARKKIIKLAKQYRAHVISVGKHSKGERGDIRSRQKYFRSMSYYLRTHRPKETELWIF